MTERLRDFGEILADKVKSAVFVYFGAICPGLRLCDFSVSVVDRYDGLRVTLELGEKFQELVGEPPLQHTITVSLGSPNPSYLADPGSIAEQFVPYLDATASCYQDEQRKASSLGLSPTKVVTPCATPCLETSVVRIKVWLYRQLYEAGYAVPFDSFNVRVVGSTAETKDTMFVVSFLDSFPGESKKAPLVIDFGPAGVQRAFDIGCEEMFRSVVRRLKGKG